MHVYRCTCVYMRVCVCAYTLYMCVCVRTFLALIQALQAEQLEQRILLQENEISNMENRNYFSLLCVQLETQLVHANLEGLYIALHIMATVEAKSHSEVSGRGEGRPGRAGGRSRARSLLTHTEQWFIFLSKDCRGGRSWN